MISSEYYLIYHHKKTGKTLLGKCITGNDYVLFDEETMEKTKINNYQLRKNYRPDIKNKKKRGYSFKNCKDIFYESVVYDGII